MENLDLILFSIKPKWCELIFEGKKKIEVRKKAPRKTPFKGLVYATKDKNYKWSGEVIGEFICNKIDTYNTSWLDGEDRLKESTCLNDEELMDYMDSFLDKDFYLINISNPILYDKSKTLDMYRKPKDIALDCGYGNFNIYEQKILRPPQSWMYIKGE